MMMDLYTDDICGLVAQLVTLYVAAAIMGIGFATMFAGSSGANAAGQFFFKRPLQVLSSGAAGIAAFLLAGTLRALGWVLARTARAARQELKELAEDVRWLVRQFDR